LILNSVGLKRVGFIGRGDTVVPFAGPGDDGALATGGLEVYGRDKLFFVQQRSPVIKVSIYAALMN
jgi:proteasome assembly chaperone 2